MPKRNDEVGCQSAWGLHNAVDKAGKVLYSSAGLPVGYNLWNADGEWLINPYDADGKVNPSFDPNITRRAGYEELESWRDAIFRVGQKTDATVRFSGGNEKVTYYTSLGYLKDEGYYIGSDYDRFTIRSNVDFKPKKWLKGSLNASYAYSTMNAAGQGDNMNNGFAYVNGMPVIYPVHLYNEDGTIKQDERTGDLAFDYGMHEGSGRGFGAGINPAGSLLYDRDNSVQHHFTAAGMLEVKFYKDLKLTVNAGLM